MTPVERGCLYGIGILAAIMAIFHTVDAWFDHLEARYWSRKGRP